jgi:hypothetical protein
MPIGSHPDDHRADGQRQRCGQAVEDEAPDRRAAVVAVAEFTVQKQTLHVQPELGDQGLVQPEVDS